MVFIPNRLVTEAKSLRNEGTKTMKPFFLKISFLLFFINQTCFAVLSQLALDPSKPDEFDAIDLPFPYHPVSSDQKFKYIYQGGSDLLTPDSEESYLIIGTLRPCFGVIFHNRSNGFQLGFHVHFSNSFESMKEIYQQRLEVKDSSQVFVQIYSHQMDEASFNRAFYSAGHRSQQEEMDDLVNFMTAHLGIPPQNINYLLSRSDYEELALGQYRNVNLNILVNKRGEIFSTCHLAEDLMKLKGTSILIENAVSQLDKDQIMLQLGKNYTGTVMLMDPNGFRDSIPVIQGKVLFDLLRIEQKHNAALNKMKLIGQIYYKRAFQNNDLLLVEKAKDNDEEGQRVYRKINFYFIPNLALQPEKRDSRGSILEAKEQKEQESTAKDNPPSSSLSSQSSCCIS